MLGEVTSGELTEWMAYFKVRSQRRKDDEQAEEAKRRAKENNG